MILSPRGSLAVSIPFLVVTTRGKVATDIRLTESSDADILQCTGQPYKRKSYEPKMSIVRRLRNPCKLIIFSLLNTLIFIISTHIQSVIQSKEDQLFWNHDHPPWCSRMVSNHKYNLSTPHNSYYCIKFLQNCKFLWTKQSSLLWKLLWKTTYYYLNNLSDHG